jgi:hypothetical protein
MILNAGNDALDVPSLTLMMMFEKVPASPDPGVPDKFPDCVLNEAQLGGF